MNPTYISSSKVKEYMYEVEDGKITLKELQEVTANFINEKTFHIEGFWDKHREFHLNEWNMYHMSSNSYQYRIYISAKDNISKYKLDIQTVILEQLAREITRLNASMKAIANDR